ncbi:predicted protein [Histoplasma mississippiense (nom. inval.)]|uniref:predicted protein n=1 Tax=Ajellomyces capsulatus (strain NAm1 / WU24) TaxID=2059318 RepID=UPI000157BEEE|nr:predicted protein [Histoplasma mississippiense (nom. inval.)]EDN06359.1 predicted protein [Histoplasma mississippiense (nom. inval.)]
MPLALDSDGGESARKGGEEEGEAKGRQMTREWLSTLGRMMMIERVRGEEEERGARSGEVEKETAALVGLAMGGCTILPLFPAVRLQRSRARSAPGIRVLPPVNLSWIIHSGWAGADRGSSEPPKVYW